MDAMQQIGRDLVNGRSLSATDVSQGSSVAAQHKMPVLNTAQIVMGDFNSAVTFNAWTTVTGAKLPFYLTDRGATGVPYVQIAQNPLNGLTLLTFTKLPFLVSNTTAISFGKLKLLTMPFGRFSINGGSCIFTRVDWATNYQAVQTTGVAGTVIGAGGSGDFSVGTTGTTDSTLSTTDVDIVASTAFIDPFVAGIGNNLATPGAVVNVPTEFDGSTTTTTGTAKSISLNVIVDDADVVDTNAGLIFLTGYLRLYTRWLGDF